MAVVYAMACHQLQSETIGVTSGLEFDDSKKGKQTLQFLCFMSNINVLSKLFKKWGITFNSPLISASFI